MQIKPHKNVLNSFGQNIKLRKLILSFVTRHENGVSPESFVILDQVIWVENTPDVIKLNKLFLKILVYSLACKHLQSDE